MHEGGGMPMKYTTTRNSYDKWYYNSKSDISPSWKGAQSLRLFIKYNTVGYPRMGYTFLSNSQVSQLQAGDIVFALESGSSSKSNRKATHVGLVSRVSGTTIYVYAHSKNKGDEKWAYSLSNTILCHFDGTILTDGSSSSWQERYGTATLKASSSYNEYVKNLQTDLISIGISCGSAGADGIFGSATTAAVKQFQSENGLTVDGLAGNATKQALYEKAFG